MKQSLILLSLAAALTPDYLEYRAPSRSLVDLGYHPTSKKRIAHRQRKAAERRQAMQTKHRSHKDRNKKGRP